MRLLITGGAGFIGSHVAQQAQQAGWQVAALDNLSSGRPANLSPDITLYQADLRDYEATQAVVASFGPDVISHHAAQASVPRSLQHPQDDAGVNVLGTLNLLEAARCAKVRRVVYASTGGAIYGEVPEGEVGHVGGPLRPVTPYAVSKLAAEHYLEVYRQHHNLPYHVLRYSNVYGERQSVHGEAGVAAIFCERLLRGAPLVINGRAQAGDMGCVRDYVYAGDVAKANLLALRGEAPQVLDVGTGVETATQELAQHLMNAAKQRVELQTAPPRRGDVQRSVLSGAALHGLLGKVTALELGLHRTVAWYREQSQNVG